MVELAVERGGLVENLLRYTRAGLPLKVTLEADAVVHNPVLGLGLLADHTVVIPLAPVV